MMVAARVRRSSPSEARARNRCRKPSHASVHSSRGQSENRDKYISGGWIFPGGKLPDASRPPVGRTRGGESHPRPV
ncbi:MAG: hypothetical protein ACQESR_21670 [Planctomycetota bacterium]